jgi:hypothetical protein
MPFTELSESGFGVAATGGTEDASGNFAFAPRIADFVDEAFERCGLDPEKLTMRHVHSARMSFNLLMQEWGTRGVKLWAVDEQPLDLVQGLNTYDQLADGTITIFDAVVRREGVDTICRPMSRSEYAAISDKDMAGLPLKFYFARIATPTVTFWPVPDRSTDQFIYYRLRRMMDVRTQAETLDATSPWFEPAASGLAEKLALKFAPARHDKLFALAERAFKIADTH